MLVYSGRERHEELAEDDYHAEWEPGRHLHMRALMSSLYLKSSLLFSRDKDACIARKYITRVQGLTAEQGEYINYELTLNL